ncbi:hypothetical protein PT015_14965 [Candidatus Mycobacterium wuenschmannii]|uniref:Transmembrane protein n=1 Tax=Candidatus Mycobacterium wuenschmannii TaxID=3027808 RepID=A0ABY8VRD8_9MYCO|nr:hypothetical protein [Candidatus Mycobacterium wuenschmannii]WIM86210.1 hypothetical protein PT015_14965 [Candidatus Mycobacterium wuenschmannii]
MTTPDGEDSVPAIAALFEAERTEVQSILGHALSLISILVAYSTVVGAAWATRPDTVPHALVPVVPIPVWLVIAWHSQLNSRLFAHNQAVVILEQKLLDHIPSITYPTRLWLGHTSGRLVNEIPILLREKRYAMAAASIITYGGLLAIVLALTVASVVVPIFVNHDWQELATVMAIVYAVVIVLLGASYKATFGIDIDSMDEWAKSAHLTFPGQFRTQHRHRDGG